MVERGHGPERAERTGTERRTLSTPNGPLHAGGRGSAVTSPEGVIADVGLDPANFPLEGAIVEGVRCTVEQFVVTDPDRLTTFLWLEGDLAGIEDSLATDDTVDRVTRVIDRDERRLYRMD